MINGNILFLESNKEGQPRFNAKGRWVQIDVECSKNYIQPTRSHINGKFEIIMIKREIRLYDKVVFYPKNSTYENGIQADIEIHSHMRIEGKVPDLPPGEYLVSLRSAIDETNKLEEDLSFTIL